MYEEGTVLCASSAYTKQFYLNPEFEGLPEGIREELKIMCVLYTEDVGGTLLLRFDEEGNLNFETDANEEDLLYDEIGSVLKIKQIQAQKADFLESLECITVYFSWVKCGRTSSHVADGRYWKYKYNAGGFQWKEAAYDIPDDDDTDPDVGRIRDGDV